MQTCDECGVGYSGKLGRCPLCGAELKGPASPEAFPVQSIQRPRKASRRVLWISTVVAMVAAIGAGIATGSAPWPVVLTCLALLVNYLFLRNILVHRPNSLRMAERWFLALLAVAVLWWLATGAPWVASLVVPSICLGALVANTVLVAAFRRTFVQGYAKYLLYDVVLGFIPLVFVVAGWVQWPWLCYASAGAALGLTLALLLLTRKQLATEMRKLFTA